MAAVKNKSLVVASYFVLSPLCGRPRKQVGTYRDILFKTFLPLPKIKDLNLPWWVGPGSKANKKKKKKSPRVNRVNMLIVNTHNVTVTKIEIKQIEEDLMSKRYN